MEKFNWKYHLKQSFEGFWDGLFFIICLMSVICMVFITQKTVHLQAICKLIQEKDFIIIVLIFIGIVFTAQGMMIFLKGVWVMLNVIFNLILMLIRKFKK